MRPLRRLPDRARRGVELGHRGRHPLGWVTGALGIARRAAALCDEAWRESGAAAEPPQPLGGGAVRTTPLPPLHEIAASYRARADGSVVFGADEAGFGPHLVTHPLTAAGLDAQLAGMLRGTAL